MTDNLLLDAKQEGSSCRNLGWVQQITLMNTRIYEVCVLALLLIVLSYSVFYGINKIYWQIYYDNQINKIDNVIQGTLIEAINDIEKALTILEAIQTKGIKNISKYFSLKAGRLDIFQIFRHPKIVLKTNDKQIGDIAHTQEIFDIIAIKKPIGVTEAIILKVDYQDIIRQIDLRINDKNIVYTLYNELGNLILTNARYRENDRHVISISKSFKRGLKLVVWIDDQAVQIQQINQKKVALLISSTFLFVILLFYILCHWFLKKSLLRKYVLEVETLRENLNKANGKIKSLDNSITNYKIATKAKLEFDLLMLRGIKLILGKVRKVFANQIILLKEIKVEEEYIVPLEIVNMDIANVYEFQLLIEQPEKVNIRSILENCILYWIQEIQRKNLKVALECNLDDIPILINQVTLTQIICSMFGTIILSVPKERHININTIFEADKGVLLEIGDNGFGMSLENVSQYSEVKEEYKKFILSWSKLTPLLKELDIKYSITSRTGEGNLIKLFIPIYQEKQQQNESNVVNLSNYKKK